MTTIAAPRPRVEAIEAPEDPDFGDNLIEIVSNHWGWLLVLAIVLVCCCCCCATLGRYLWRRKRKRDLKHHPRRYYKGIERKEWFPRLTTTMTPSTGPNGIFDLGPSSPPGDLQTSRRASTRSRRQVGQQQQPQLAGPFAVPGPAQPGAFGQPLNQQMAGFPQPNQGQPQSGFPQAQGAFQQQQQAPLRSLAFPSPQQLQAGYPNQPQRGPAMQQQRPPAPPTVPGQPRVIFGQQLQPQRPPLAQNYQPQQQY